MLSTFSGNINNLKGGAWHMNGEYKFLMDNHCIWFSGLVVRTAEERKLTTFFSRFHLFFEWFLIGKSHDSKIENIQRNINSRFDPWLSNHPSHHHSGLTGNPYITFLFIFLVFSLYKIQKANRNTYIFFNYFLT